MIPESDVEINVLGEIHSKLNKPEFTFPANIMIYICEDKKKYTCFAFKLTKPFGNIDLQCNLLSIVNDSCTKCKKGCEPYHQIQTIRQRQFCIKLARASPALKSTLTNFLRRRMIDLRFFWSLTHPTVRDGQEQVQVSARIVRPPFNTYLYFYPSPQMLLLQMSWYKLH